MSGPRPNVVFKVANICATLSSFATSQVIGIAVVENSPATSLATCATWSAERAATATLAPSLANANAIARPIPRPPPVINAILF